MEKYYAFIYYTNIWVYSHLMLYVPVTPADSFFLNNSFKKLATFLFKNVSFLESLSLQFKVLI